MSTGAYGHREDLFLKILFFGHLSVWVRAPRGSSILPWLRHGSQHGKTPFRGFFHWLLGAVHVRPIGLTGVHFAHAHPVKGPLRNGGAAAAPAHKLAPVLLCAGRKEGQPGFARCGLCHDVNLSWCSLLRKYFLKNSYLFVHSAQKPRSGARAMVLAALRSGGRVRPSLRAPQSLSTMLASPPHQDHDQQSPAWL